MIAAPPEKKVTDDEIHSIDNPVADAGYTVARLRSSIYYINENMPIQKLVDLFNDRASEVNAVGVVTGGGEFKGIIIRKELMKLVSRPFGLDVLKKKPVSRVCLSSRSFECNTLLPVVCDELREEMRLQKESFYAILDKQGGYAGIFSTRDLLIHMAEQNRKDMILAREVQTSMVKNRHNVLAFGLEVASSYTPAQGVGGDFYLTRKINETDWVLMLCDVSGKGVAASIVTAMLYGITRTYDFRRGIKSFVRDLNSLIFETFRGDRFLTGIFMLYNEETGRMSVLDMGHSYLSLIRGGRVMKMTSSMDNLPVGISEDLIPKAGRLKLEFGDILVTLTDGLVEQKNPNGHFYDMERMEDLVKVNHEDALEDIRDRILEDFEYFRQDTPYHDDMTFLLIRYPLPEEEMQ